MAEEAVVTVADTGAEPISQTAEVGGTETEVSEGAETQESQAAESGEETGETEESGTVEDGTEEENKDRGSHQKTLEERAAEIAEKKAQEYIERVEKERQEKEAVVKPPFIELSREAIKSINRDINLSIAREQDILNEIALDPDEADPALTHELRAIRVWRQGVENELAENAQKRTEFLRKQQEEQNAKTDWDARQSKIVEVMRIMQDHEKVPDEVVDAIRNKWLEIAKSDPTLQEEFDDYIRSGQFTKGVKFARDIASKALKESAQKTIEQKETGKAKQVGGGSEPESVNFENVKSWGDLEKLHSRDINRFVREHPKKFAEIKRKRFK